MSWSGSEPQFKPETVVRWVTNGVKLVLFVDVRDGLDQRAGVFGLRVGKERPALTFLDDTAVTQHDCSIAHHAHYVEIVTDKKQREVILAL